MIYFRILLTLILSGATAYYLKSWLLFVVLFLIMVGVEAICWKLSDLERQLKNFRIMTPLDNTNRK